MASAATELSVQLLGASCQSTLLKKLSCNSLTLSSRRASRLEGCLEILRVRIGECWHKGISKKIISSHRGSGGDEHKQLYKH